MRGPGCAHAKRVFLLAGTVHASVKFKSSCTVCAHVLHGRPKRFLHLVKGIQKENKKIYGTKDKPSKDKLTY